MDYVQVFEFAHTQNYDGEIMSLPNFLNVLAKSPKEVEGFKIGNLDLIFPLL